MAQKTITITDNMRLWGIALVAARDWNKEENADLGFSDAVMDALAIQDASKQVELDPIETAAIKQLIKENRLGELAK